MRTPGCLGLLVHQVHVGDQRVGAVRALAMRVGLRPELLRVDADLRQERVFLHRRGDSVPSKS